MSGPMSNSNIKTFTVHGVKFASGLVWRKLERARNYKKEAFEYGRKHNFDMVAIRRRGNVSQAGYAPKGLNHLKGSYSLAAFLAHHLGNGWLGAFEITEDTFAVVCVLPDGSIMPGLDNVFGREEAQNKLRETFALLGDDVQFAKAKKVYGPDSFEAEKEIRLEDLVKPKGMKADHRLRPINFGFGLKGALGVAAVLLVIAGGGGAYAYMKHREEVQLALAAAAELAKQEELAIKAKAAAEEERVRKANAQQLTKPWLTAPTGIEVVRGCASAEQLVPLSLGGWIFTQSTCSGAGLVATYRRSTVAPTTVAQFAEAVNARMGSAATIIDAGEAGTVNFPVEAPVNVPAQLNEANALLVALTARMQALGSAGGVDFSYTEKLFTPDPNSDAPTASPDWRTSQYTITTKLPPRTLLADLDTTGLYVTSIETRLAEQAELTWTITGEIYGK